MSVSTIQEGGCALLTAHGDVQGCSAPSPWVVGERHTYMSHRGKSLGGLNSVVSRAGKQEGSFQKGRRRRPSRVFPHPTLPGALLVELTRGRVAVVDEGDRELVDGCPWYLDKQGYAAGRPDGRLTTLHLHLWRARGGAATEDVDHIDRDRLDCRRTNLRAATHAENMRNRGRHSNNTSGVKGVSRFKGRWRARVYVNRRAVDLGIFDTVPEAAQAYAVAAAELHGEFVRLS